MIYFVVFAIGALTGVILTVYLGKVNAQTKETGEPTREQERLNIAKQEREKLLKELQRQYENLMSYNGKEQRG